MSNKTDKYTTEAQALLVNLKIAIQQFEKDPDPEINREVLAELFNQLTEISGIYGVYSVGQLSDKVLVVLKSVHRSGQEIDEEVITYIARSEELLRKLITDPLLHGKGLKGEFDNYIRKGEELLKVQEGNAAAPQSGSRFQEVFMEEAFDLFNQLEEKMLQLESDPQDTGMIDQVFRIMHTLKGNSNMFGYQYLGKITHELENIYDNIRDGSLELSRHILEITLECIDLFRKLLDDAELADDDLKEHYEEFLGTIQQITSGDGEAEPDQPDKKKPEKGKDFHTFYLFFRPEKDIFNDGSNPLYFIYDLHETGECLPVPVFHPEMLRSGFNPEECHTAWHIALATDSTEDEIREHFMFLREESQPSIRILSGENLMKHKKFPDFFKKQVEGKTSMVEINTSQFLSQVTKRRMQASEQASKNGGEAISSVRVSSQKIDQMMNLISELVIKQAELGLLALDQDNPQLLEVVESIENISRDLRDNAFSISLIPLEKTVLRFQRLVRDVSRRFGKKVDFVVEGKDTELDKTIIEKIVDPIMHILRNSIDHGIELPAARRKKGKPETGTILLKAYPSGAHVVIEISDDGAGIDLDKVQATALRKGMITSADSLTHDELLHLIVSPGFSTAENISEVSGRGVGMDVVNQKISEIRGELEMKTEKDKGTVITIKLPLTISIIDSLLMKCAGDYYLVPLALVNRCAEMKAKTVLGAENNYVVLDGEYIPFIDLRSEFGIEQERPEVQQILMVSYRDITVGLVIDEVIGNYQAVLKSLGAAYRKQEIISGASILGSGEIALVLDVSKIIQEYSTRIEMKVNAAV